MFFTDVGMVKREKGAGRDQEGGTTLFIGDAGVNEFGEEEAPGGMRRIGHCCATIFELPT